MLDVERWLEMYFTLVVVDSELDLKVVQRQGSAEKYECERGKRNWNIQRRKGDLLYIYFSSLPREHDRPACSPSLLLSLL